MTWVKSLQMIDIESLCSLQDHILVVTVSLVGKILEFCFAAGKEIFDSNKQLYWAKTLDTKTLKARCVLRYSINNVFQIT